jgi:hypothetical protein
MKKVKLNWLKNACGGESALIPAELGGRSTPAHRQSFVQLTPRAFGSTKTRVRLSNHALERYFFFHQFYASTREAKSVLMLKLIELKNNQK